MSGYNYGGGNNSSFSSWEGFSSKVSSSTQNLFSSVSSSASQYIPVGTSPFASNSEPEPEWFGLTLFQRWAGFAICALAGFLLLFMSMFKIFNPAKFSLSFTFGSLLLFMSFGFLKGPRSHFKHVFSRERLPFTLSYFGSLSMSVFFSVIYKSHILSILFFVIQVIALIWYFASYLPGGSATMARSASSLLPFYNS